MVFYFVIFFSIRYIRNAIPYSQRISDVYERFWKTRDPVISGYSCICAHDHDIGERKALLYIHQWQHHEVFICVWVKCENQGEDGYVILHAAPSHEGFLLLLYNQYLFPVLFPRLVAVRGLSI